MADLDRVLMERARRAPEATLTVIVRLSQPVADAVLAGLGLVVIHRFDRLPGVSGTVRGADIARLATLPEVVRIEPDAPLAGS